MDVNPLPVSGGYAGALLTAVLQGEQAKKGNPGYILTWGIYAKKAAALPQFSPN